MNPDPDEMEHVHIDFSGITSEEEFHQRIQETMGFPDTYGRDMSAWITCMSFLGDPNRFISSRIKIGPTDRLCIEVHGTEEFMNLHPTLFCSFVECIAFVNQRHLAGGQSPALHLMVC